MESTRVNLPLSHACSSFHYTSGVIRPRSLVNCWGNQADGLLRRGQEQEMGQMALRKKIRYRAGNNIL
jgi:hypothetical protein